MLPSTTQIVQFQMASSNLVQISAELNVNGLHRLRETYSLWYPLPVDVQLLEIGGRDISIAEWIVSAHEIY